MLSNVTLVSEDTDGRGQAMVRSSARVEKLAERRADVRDQVSELAPREKALRNQQAKVDSRVASASAVLEDLEAKAEQKRMAEAGGPAVAYAKAQVGKSYVYGAIGPGLVRLLRSDHGGLEAGRREPAAQFLGAVRCRSANL